MVKIEGLKLGSFKDLLDTLGIFNFRHALLHFKLYFLYFRHSLLLYLQLSLLFIFDTLFFFIFDVLFFCNSLFLIFNILFFIFDLLIYIIFYILIFVISDFLIFDALFFFILVDTYHWLLITSNPLVN